ncbi:hypothetical protein [Bacillus sp. AFS033286]|uniref:hypothetical protein n=1 Tax=Bacillus sp. AFS033286 TaxID=2033498 RepID=UPI000BFD283F|nr:hypothetical protein [Bacillus sp. AFS033286]PGX06876.1 hypothetical protein COE07_22340 [Bacillus sp. AFS033286]
MYVVEFLPKEQSKRFEKFLRKYNVSTGKQLRLSDAETLIQSYQNDYRKNDQVVLSFQDLDNEKAYDFEIPVEANEPFSLLKAVEKDLDNEDTDFSLVAQVKQGIFQTYKNEQNQETTKGFDIESKKGGWFSKIFKGKEKGVSAENVALLKDDVQETKFDSFPTSADLHNDFEEMEEDKMKTGHPSFFDPNEIAALEKVAVNLTKESDGSFITAEEEMLQPTTRVEEKLPIKNVVENPVDDIEKEILSMGLEPGNENVTKEEPVVDVNSNAREIEFPDYDKYLNLNKVKEKQERYASRFSVNYLLNLLGIEKESPKTELEIRQLKYAKNVLSNKQFALIQDAYYQDVDNTEDEIRMYLEQEYKAAMMRDYSNEAEIALQALFVEIDQNTLAQCNIYENNERCELERKLELFQEKQRLELEAFQVNQQAVLKEHQIELEKRKSQLVNAYEERLTKENEQNRKQALQEKVYELKLNAKKALIDYKNKSLSHFANTIEDLMNVAFESQQDELSRIEEDIEIKTLTWRKEIETEKEQELERERLQLEKQELHLKTRKHEDEVNKGQDKETIRILEDQLYVLTNKLNKAYAGFGQPQPVQQPMYQQPAQQQPVYQQPMYQQAQSVQQPMYQQPAQQQPMYQQVMPEQQMVQQPQRTGLFGWLFGR